jgi:hypothetical protein
MSKRIPPVIEALGKGPCVRRLSDENLELLYDYTLIAFLQAQHELGRRGIRPEALVERTACIAALSTDPGQPPLCKCMVRDEGETFVDRDGVVRPAFSDAKPAKVA